MSSGSENDEDFVPGEPEQLSEEDSADEETDLQFEKEQQLNSSKRKAKASTKSKKKQKTTRSTRELTPEVEVAQKTELKVNPEDEKRKEDDLWAKFLEGTDTKPKVVTKDNVKTTQDTTKPYVAVNTVNNNKKEEDDKSKERKIFEFAGETIVVENNIIKEKIKPTEKSKVTTVSTASSPASSSSKGRSGGLSNILGQLNKTNKLSTLEKSKLDWQTYKKEEGVEEEIQTINKGKAGYLDRQDFLERADMRQYELEREMRMTRRSNR